MKTPRAVLVIRPDQVALIDRLSPYLAIVGVHAPTKKRIERWSLPFSSGLDDMLKRGKPDICGLFTPYAGMGEDALRCIEQSVHLAAPGPVSDTPGRAETLLARAAANGIRVHCGGSYRFDRLFQTIHRQRQDAAFGRPVFLRFMSGGGINARRAWWSACEALERAEALIGEALQALCVTAVTLNRVWHVTLTAAFQNGASAQLGVAPVMPPCNHDAMLLGTGGMISYDSAINTSGVLSRTGWRPVPPYGYEAEAAWFVDCASRMAADQNTAILERGRRIREAIREACRQRGPVSVAL